MSGYWFPICEDCDTDAVSLRHADGAWWFHCPPHSRLGDRAIRDVELGWRPDVQDSPWNAARTAVRGVRKSAVAAPPVLARHLHVARDPEPAPAWTPHDTLHHHPVLIEGHWADGTPFPDEPSEEEYE